MGKTRLAGQFQSVQNRAAFAAVARQTYDAQIRIRGGHLLQFFAGAVGAAVDYHPNGNPLFERTGERVKDLVTGIETGDEHQMRGGRPIHGQSL